MIIRQMHVNEADNIRQIDRSEQIDRIYKMNGGQLETVPMGHECPTWDEEHTDEMVNRFRRELEQGGTAYGAFDGEVLAGFGVLGHRFRGRNQDQLQVDLMYVSRPYRRQGLATRIMNELSRVAKERGASYLYISSTETESAVGFYRANGGNLTEEVDEELYQQEPEDIHMLKKL